jgi:hypothetical protein
VALARATDTRAHDLDLQPHHRPGHRRARGVGPADSTGKRIGVGSCRRTVGVMSILRPRVHHAPAGGRAMNDIRVIVTGAEEAYDYEAEFWCADQMMGVTVLHEGRLHLRIDPRADGLPWLPDVASLASALAEAEQRLASY